MYAESGLDIYVYENFFKNKIGNMVEIGAGHPTYISMSKYFRELGWRCICIDANPKFVDMHKKLGHEAYNYACADFEGVSKFSVYNTGMWDEENEGISYSSLELRYEKGSSHEHTEIEVEVITLSNLLDKIGVKTLEYISVDVEGWELEVLKGLDFKKFNLQVVALENVSHDHKYTDFMTEKEFSLVHYIKHNYIFKNDAIIPNIDIVDTEVRKYGD